LIIELFNKILPKTCENFRALCTGERGQNLSYKGKDFNRMTPNFTMKGGNIVNKNGTGHQSIYGGVFQDEGVWIRHTEQGLLSMVNSGPNTNGS
jgi:peptidylprolyl isomerase